MEDGAPPSPNRASSTASCDRTAYLFAPSRQFLARLEHAPTPGWELRGTTGWCRFREILSPFAPAVIGLEDPDETRVARLTSWRFQGHGSPLILALNPNPAWIPVVTRAGVRALAVVWWPDVAGCLHDALERCGQLRPLEVADAMIRSADGLCHPLATALRHAVRRRPPLTTVNRWVAEIDLSRSTLFRHWRQSFGDRVPLTPKEFLDCVLLVHAFHLRRRCSRWAPVADQLGISPRTLRRICGRRLQSSLADLALTADADAATPSLGFVGILKQMIRPPTGWPAE